MKIYTIDYTTFTKGASLVFHESGDAPKNLGNSQRPLDAFLLFSIDSTKKADMVVVKHFKGDENAELIKVQLRTRGYNVQESIVGGN